jgi:hypothetical protein
MPPCYVDQLNNMCSHSLGGRPESAPVSQSVSGSALAHSLLWCGVMWCVQSPGVAVSYGIEHEPVRWHLALHNLRHILDHAANANANADTQGRQGGRHLLYMAGWLAYDKAPPPFPSSIGQTGQAGRQAGRQAVSGLWA